MLHDIRFAARMLRKQPAIALIAALTLALGIGSTAAVFSLVQGVLWTAPPYEAPDRLVLLPSTSADGRPTNGNRGWAWTQWREWSEKAESLESVAGYDWTFNYLITQDGSESVSGMRVSEGFLQTLGVQPVEGRAFTDEESTHPAEPVILLGYELWQRKYQGDPGIIGQTVRLSRMPPQTVVGVLPPRMRFLPSPRAAQEPNYDVNATVDYLAPFTVEGDNLRRPGWQLVGRLAEGVTPEQAEAELRLLTERQGEADADFAGYAPLVEPLSDFMNRDGKRILLPLLGAAGLVLLIACGNAAALLLVRGLQRQQEYAVRSALGVGRAALFRQVSVESLVLALAGGTMGVGLAYWIVQLFKASSGQAIPRLDAVSAGWPVLACGLAMAVASALVAGFIPAYRASRIDPSEAIKGAGPKASVGRLERRLVRGVTMAQTAITLVLLVGAGLLVRTMTNLAGVESGYQTSRVLTMSVTSVEGDWRDFHMRALEEVSAMPGVEHAAFAWGVPLTGNSWPGLVEVEGRPPAANDGERISVPVRSVTPDYFELMGIRVVEGRGFRDDDTGDRAGVAIVNQAFVDAYFPDGRAVGRTIWNGDRSEPGNEIIGVINNMRSSDMSADASPEIYASFWQAGPFSKHLVVRTAAEPTAMAAAIEREILGVNPSAAVEHVKTLEQIQDESLAARTFVMQLLSGFSIVGGALTLIGIYGVLALSVTARLRELAIRAAVGAERGDLRGLVYGEAFRLIGVGVLIGGVAAVFLSRALRSFLYEIEPGDPATLLGVAALFLATALAACWNPARRAANVDPAEALRAE